MITIISGGIGHGPLPDAHLRIDLRPYRDPHVNPRLRERTSHHRDVRRTVLRTRGVRALLRHLTAAARAYTQAPSAGDLQIVVYCTGGRHRAPTVAEALARRLRRRGQHVTVHHRDQHKPVLPRSEKKKEEPQ